MTMILNQLHYKNKKISKCEICERAQPLQFHHLIPKKVHSKPRYRRIYGKEVLNWAGIMICKLCHKQLHMNFTHVQLAEHLNTLNKILANEDMKKFIIWAKKQK